MRTMKIETILIAFGMLIISVNCQSCKSGDTTGDPDYKHDKGKSDDLSNMVYLLTTTLHKFTCCGVVRHYKSYGAETGKIEYMLWRPTGEKDKYWLAAASSTDVSKGKASSFAPSSHVQVQAGDVMGWYNPGAVTVPYDPRDIDGSALMMQMNSKPEVGDKVDWSKATKKSNRVYALESQLVEATEVPKFKSIKTSLDLPEDTPQGTRVYTINVHDPGMADTVVTMETNSYFAIDDTDARSILVKAPLAIGSFEVKVTATDICGLATSASITINVQEVEAPKTDAPTTKTPDVDVTTQAPDVDPVTTQAPDTSGNVGSNVSYVMLSPFDNQRDDRDGWKIGAAFGTIMLLGAAIAIIVWDRWAVYRVKHNGTTTPDAEKADTAKPESTKAETNGTSSDKTKLAEN